MPHSTTPKATLPKPKVILDCDPGHDDAIAILLAAHRCEVLGITTVSGNVPLDKTTRNALLVTQLLEMDTPVHAGAERPLLAAASHAEDIHGESGLGGVDLPALGREPAGRDAVRFIVETARREDDLWLVALGPLTNVALALTAAPDIAGRLRGVSLMGGSACGGNITPAAEFNVWADPEAAAIVFASGAAITMCGLDLTRRFTMDRAEIERIRALGSRTAHLVADLLGFYGQAYRSLYAGREPAPLHDPCAVLAVSDPELFELKARNVGVETAGRLTRGMTVVDDRGIAGAEAANARVACGIDAPRGKELLLEAIASCP